MLDSEEGQELTMEMKQLSVSDSLNLLTNTEFFIVIHLKTFTER